jgi:hypothetical protein
LPLFWFVCLFVLFCALLENGIQGFAHARKAVCQLSYLPSRDSWI